MHLAVDRVLKALPRPQARLLQAAWQQLGPTQLSDIDAAQRKLIELAIQRNSILTPAGSNECL